VPGTWWGMMQSAPQKTYPPDAKVLSFECPRCGATIDPQWDKFQDAERSAWHPGPTMCISDLIEEAACRLLD
jgi:hypothetical protein